jgi:hypothetical protein
MSNYLGNQNYAIEFHNDTIKDLEVPIPKDNVYNKYNEPESAYSKKNFSQANAQMVDVDLSKPHRHPASYSKKTGIYRIRMILAHRHKGHPRYPRSTKAQIKARGGTRKEVRERKRLEKAKLQVKRAEERKGP